MSEHPFLKLGFEINWSKLTPECVVSDIERGLELAAEGLKSVETVPLETVNYENTIGGLESATDILDEAWGKVCHLDSVCNGEALREVYNTMLPKVSDFYTKILLNGALWERVKAFSKTEEAAGLEGIEKRHFEETYADFADNGAELEGAKKERLEVLNAELAKMTQQYAEHVLDATNAWSYIEEDAGELAGIPEMAIEAARLDALKHGEGSEDEPKWRFTLHAPSVMPVLQYADSDALRERVWRASNAVGHAEPYDNTALIKEILKRRHEKAELLGHKDFADLTLKRRMAKDGASALAFTEDLKNRVEKAFKEEVFAVESFRADAKGVEVERMQPWEFGYWAEKRRQAMYDFDEEALRPYFPMEAVEAGMYQLVENLYGIEVLEVDLPAERKWHEQVKYYEIVDEDGRMLGAFYTDWYPRESKRGGAWMNYLITGEDGKPHLGLICGNMTPGVGGKPALLNHREVETVFHEFGHLLHHILSEVPVKSLHGTSVAWDFVELPSQIMENWCWERESLDLFARHYETGETIPEDLFQKMTKARNYLSATATMRQLSIGKMDLDLHVHYQKYCDGDLDAAIDEILEGYLIEYKEKVPSLVRRIGHLFSDPTGYAAGYYSYKWAEVLDADAFTRFKKEGLMSREVGMEFRKKILSQGNSRPADALFL